MIRFDNLPPLVIGVAASLSLLWLPDSSLLCGQAKIGFFCMDPPSSGGFMAWAGCSVGAQKIGDDEAVAFQNTEVFCEPSALRVGN